MPTSSPRSEPRRAEAKKKRQSAKEAGPERSSGDQGGQAATEDETSPAGGHHVVPPPARKPSRAKGGSVSAKTGAGEDYEPPSPDPDLPEALNRLLANPRITVRRGGAPDPTGKCVVYWCQRAERGTDNHALNVAVEAANQLGLPVLVYFAGISDFPHANLRHYAFLNQGLPDLSEDCAARNVGFVFRRAPHEAHLKLFHDAKAAMVIGDENPMRVPESWRAELAKTIRIPFWTVDADVIVPSRLFPKLQYAAYTMRPKLYKLLPAYLSAFENPKAEHAWRMPSGFHHDSVTEDMTLGWKRLDRSVPPVAAWRGGAHAARERLKVFVETILPEYDQTRNKPEIDGTSRLSPWLHYGHICAQTIALAVDEAAVRNPGLRSARDSFFNELIAWRELCVNFVRFNPNYDNVACAEPWAQTTIAEHANDKRDPLYTIEQMERAETYDELWNAAQIQMVDHGWMHNYLRMYWAKKILEWSPDNATAFRHAVYLNDKYFLDGRDPGGYAGIAWAIVGKFDRPWNQHPVFGKIRYMSGASTGRKFNSKLYIREMRRLRGEREASAAAPEDVAAAAQV